jgi:hypothetical protein
MPLSLALLDDIRNALGCTVRYLMRPHANYLPAIGPQPDIGVTIAFLVGQDLRTPEFGILLRPRRVFRTAMPKTPVDEHSDARTDERDIGHSAWFGQDCDLDSVAQSERSKLAAQ